MSALNVTKAEADVLISALNMLAKVHENASGVIPSEVVALLDKLAPEVVVAEVVVAPTVAPTKEPAAKPESTEDE